MVMAHPFVSEIPSIWFDKWRCEDAEKNFREKQSGSSDQAGGSNLVSEIAKARRQIQNSLNRDSVTIAGGADNAIVSRLESLEIENKELRKITDDLRQMLKSMENRISTLESGSAKSAPSKAPEPPKASKPADDDDDDDFELFGSDSEEEDEEAEKIREARLAQYAEKKANKKAVIAKSNIILDVKPWDDETDMGELEKCVRSIQKDGLVWGASKLVPLAFGIKKLQITCVVEDDKVGTDDLEEDILAFEDYIQSMDIAAFNKI